MESKHFKGKTIPEHLREARLRGASVEKENHGHESSGYLAAFFDSFKESGAVFLMLWVVLSQFSFSTLQIAVGIFALSLGLIAWKWGRSSLLSWARLERLHRIIEEERYEIHHHRAQEKKELMEMYHAKGFTGKMLEDVVEILMADDNRLLHIMLEEELGLTLESYEHPLKQGLGAGLGVFSSVLICLGLHFAFPSLGIIIGAGFISLLSGILVGKREQNRLLNLSIWNLSICYLAAFICYFATHFFLTLVN